MKQDKNETLKRRLEKIGGHRDKCEFSSITAEEIITYKFAATIKDKKARDKFSKGPLKLKMVLETIELDNYNRKYGDKKQKIKSPEKAHQTVHQKTNRSHIRTTHESERQQCSRRRRYQTEIAVSAENQTGPWSTEARHENNSAIIVRRWDTLPNYAYPEPSTGYVKHRGRRATASLGRKESVNAINRVDFYKAILLVQGQPIEFIIDTGSPVSIIPPVIIPTEIKKASKSFVDVNKNPIKFKGEAMVEVKTEKSKEILPILKNESKIHNHCWVWIGETNWKLDCREPRKPTSFDILTQTKDERELSMNTKTYSKTSTQLKILRSISS